MLRAASERRLGQRTAARIWRARLAGLTSLVAWMSAPAATRASMSGPARRLASARAHVASACDGASRQRGRSWLGCAPLQAPARRSASHGFCLALLMHRQGQALIAGFEVCHCHHERRGAVLRGRGGRTVGFERPAGDPGTPGGRFKQRADSPALQHSGPLRCGAELPGRGSWTCSST